MKKVNRPSAKGFFRQYSRQIFYSLLIVCVGVAGYFIVFSRAAVDVNTTEPTAPALYITPRSQTLGNNETFTIEVRTKSATTQVNAVQANLSYSTTFLDFVSLDTSSSAFSIEAESDTATPGLIKLGRGETNSVSGDSLVARVTFKTKASSASVPIDFAQGSRLLKASDNTDLLGAGDLYSADYVVDSTGPIVTMTSPANNSSVDYASSVNVSANASDSGSGLEKVEFFVNGQRQRTDSSAPYTFNWDTSGIGHNQAVELTAKAFDRVGNTRTTSVTNVTVLDRQNPSVQITAPQASEEIKGTYTFKANASDGQTGVSKVAFNIDGGTKGYGTEDANSPYEYSLNTDLLEDGTYTLTATAFDNATTANKPEGNTASNSVTFVVDNSDKIAPTQPGNLRTTSIGEGSVELVWDASTDNIGVTSYELSRDGQVLMNNLSTDFTDSGLQPSTEYNYSVVAIDAAGNRSQAASLSVTTLNPVPGDTNGDRIVDIVDLSRLLSAWGTNNGFNADFNGDNTVDIVDLSILLSNWTR